MKFHPNIIYFNNLQQLYYPTLIDLQQITKINPYDPSKSPWKGRKDKTIKNSANERNINWSEKISEWHFIYLFPLKFVYPSRNKRQLSKVIQTQVVSDTEGEAPWDACWWSHQELSAMISSICSHISQSPAIASSKYIILTKEIQKHRL